MATVDTFIQIAIALAVVFFSCLFIFGTIGTVRMYNLFHILQQKARAQLSNIGNTVQRRYDMLLALAQTIKVYNAHEYQTLKDTIASRRFNAHAPPQEQRQQIQDMQDSMIKILATLEAYPEIKANTLHQNFMAQTSEIEGRLQNSRDSYNYIVQEYNTVCMVFPNCIIAKIFHFRLMPFLDYEQQRPYEPRKVYAEF